MWQYSIFNIDLCLIILMKRIRFWNDRIHLLCCLCICIFSGHYCSTNLLNLQCSHLFHFGYWHMVENECGKIPSLEMITFACFAIPLWTPYSNSLCWANPIIQGGWKTLGICCPRVILKSRVIPTLAALHRTAQGIWPRSDELQSVA